MSRLINNGKKNPDYKRLDLYNRVRLMWRKLRRIGWIKWSIVSIFAVLCLSFLGFAFIIYGGGLIVDERAMVLPATTEVLTEDGEFAGRLFSENRRLVSIEDVPEHVLIAFIATEDERFYTHAGVDFRSVMRAVYRDVIAFDKVEGASTITQQLSKNLFLDNTQSWMRKTKEVMASLYLERNYTKSELLELYLNELYFAHGIHGIGTASEYFFGKATNELSINEGALLAGMIKGPNLYSPYINEERALERRNIALGQMHRLNYLSAEELLSLQGQTLGVQAQPQGIPEYIDDYLEVVIREIEEKYNITRKELQRGGYEVIVHLDLDMQRIAHQIIQDDQYFHGSTEGIDTSFVIYDPKSSGMKVIIGGRNYRIGENHQALTNRQPGSAIKPLAVYAPALDLGYHPYSLLTDLQEGVAEYPVRNANHVYDSEVTLVDALVTSKNTSAVWLMNELGINQSKAYLDKMDLTMPDQGLAIALGGLTEGLTPIQMAEGFGTLLNGGVFQESQTVISLKDRHGRLIEPLDSEREDQPINVFSEQASWYTIEMLEATVERGTAQRGDYAKALAGKTGTTQHPTVDNQAKDAWFLGMTPDFVVANWIGYDRSDDAHYLTQGSGQSVELTKTILSEIDRFKPITEAFKRPNHLVALPDPIELPRINNLEANFGLRGFNLLQAQLTWTASEDERIVYRVYEVSTEGNRLLGQTEGEGRFTINRPSILNMTRYVIEPYNPLTNQEGELSNIAMLHLFN